MHYAHNALQHAVVQAAHSTPACSSTVAQAAHSSHIITGYTTDRTTSSNACVMCERAERMSLTCFHWSGHSEAEDHCHVHSHHSLLQRPTFTSIYTHIHSAVALARTDQRLSLPVRQQLNHRVRGAGRHHVTAWHKHYSSLSE